MKLLRMLPRFSMAYRDLPILEGRESWSREEITAHQLDRINRLWGHATASVPYYMKLSTSRRLPCLFSSLEEFRAKVPVLDKQTVREFPHLFKSERPFGGYETTTSGSTGMPMTFYCGFRAHQSVLRARYRFYSSWGVDILDKTAFLWGSDVPMVLTARDLPGVAKEHIMDRLRGRLRMHAYDLSPAALRSNLQRITTFQPAMLYGMAQAVYLLAEQARKTNTKVPSLKVVVISSESATPLMVETIREAFDVPVVSEYGATECNLIAGTAADDTMRVREDVVYVETLQREDDLHDIAITVLENHNFPLIRYSIGDVTSGPVEYVPRGFAILPPIAGREDDVIYASDGTKIHATQVDRYFERLVGLAKRYQLHQSADGTVLVRVELANSDDTSQLHKLKELLAELFGSLAVSIEVVDRINQHHSGKHRVVTSDKEATSDAQAEAQDLQIV